MTIIHNVCGNSDGYTDSEGEDRRRTNIPNLRNILNCVLFIHFGSITLSYNIERFVFFVKTLPFSDKGRIEVM